MEKLFESVPRARLLRLFLRNTDIHFTFSEIVTRSRLRHSEAQKELVKLLNLGFIKKRTAQIREGIVKKSKSSKKPNKIIFKTKNAKVYCANLSLPVLKELQGLIIKSSVASRKKLFDRIKKLGTMKLVILSGVFLNNDRARTDLLIVGDNIKKWRLEKFLAEVESELGRSLRYTVMDTNEFKYRLDMYDRFLRDILEYQHEKLINRVHL